MSRRNGKRKGFTLTEILVALAIFALGGTAIMALFITNIRLSRQAMDYTRAAEITRNIRSLMTKSMTRPINRGEDNIYEFYYPQTSLTFESDRYIDEYEATGDYAAGTPPTDQELGGSYEDARVFFRLPKQTFNATAGGNQDNASLIRLPSDGLNSAGGNMNFDNGDPRVFRLLPDPLRRVGATEGLDADDRMFYQFDVSIRRSVQRASVEDPNGGGFKMPLEDLYVVHVKIYKGFEFEGDVVNDPYFEWDFYVNAAR